MPATSPQTPPPTPSPQPPPSASTNAATRTAKRAEYLSWPDYFMATAFLAAQRSKDPHTQVGACVVNAAHRIVGVGYNGFPRGCSDDAFPWHKPAPSSDASVADARNAAAVSVDPLDHKYMYVCHAEVNAVLNKNCATVAGCELYVALFPCNECAKICIQSGIRRVWYLSDKHAHKASTRAARRMFEAAGVQCEQYRPTCERIVIDLRAEAEADVTDGEVEGGCNGVGDEDADLALATGALRLAEVAADRNGSGATAGGGEISPQPHSTTATSFSSGKRTDYLSWPAYFMATAQLAAQRSKDPSTQVGACIVNSHRQIVGIGYNGMPHGCSDDTFPWTRRVVRPDAIGGGGDDGGADVDSKYLYVCHAEVNAILNSNAADVRGCTLYVALFPCNECAKMCIQAGISHVVYLSDKYARTAGTRAARRLFAAAGVRTERFSGGDEQAPRTTVVVDFGDIERRNYSQLPATPE